MNELPFFFFGDHRDCTYCGEPASSVDHVICIASQTVKRKSCAKTSHGPITPACRDCNNRLGSKMFDTFDLRCEYVHWGLEKEAKPILWHGWEIAKLDPSLMEIVSKERNRRMLMRMRADWFGSRDYLITVENLGFVEELHPGSDSFHEALYEYFKPTLLKIKYLYRKQ